MTWHPLLKRFDPMFIGGPLNGRTLPRQRGRLPIYRHDDGTPMRPFKGDAIFIGNAPRRLSGTGSGYTHQTHGVAQYIGNSCFRPGQDFYVHSSVIDAWQTRADLMVERIHDSAKR